MKKLFYISAWAGIISAMGLLMLVGFWLIYPYNPVTYNNLPHTVDKQEYKPGESLYLTVDFCRYSNIVPEIRRSFVDGVVYNLHSTVSPSNEIGCFVRQVGITVPTTLNPGTYYITTNFRYKVNPIRTIEIITVSQKFQVVK
jgi:hypothetical protein